MPSPDQPGKTAHPGRAPAFWRHYAPELIIIFYLVVVSAIFVAFPSIDLAVSGVFHDATGFPAARIGALITLRRLGDQLVIIVVLAIVASWIAKLIWPSRPLAIRPRSSLFLIASLAIGPGLVVNLLFKDLWGRPRPVQVFDGTPFVPAWQISDFCQRNCSFVSGEASSAMWLVALVLLAPRELRRIVAMPVGLIILALSANRIAFGGHFLSDVLLAWGMTLLIVLLLWRLIVDSRSGAWIDGNVERSMTRAGLALRRRWPPQGGKPGGPS